MKRIVEILAVAAVVLSLSSCGKSRAEQMAMAENVQIVCNPEQLALVGEQIPVEITTTYPKGYFNPKATMVVTPVLVYEGGQQQAASYTYQGDKVKDNNKVASSKGATLKEKFNFTYAPGMEASYLELRSVVFYGKKRIEVPAVKVAEGLNTTCKLADVNGAYQYKEDAYQDVIASQVEGRILYDVNSASVKNSELKSSSIKDMQESLAEASADERYTVKGTSVIAYASPEGGQNLNAKLSDNRAKTAEKAWNKISKGLAADEVKVESMGQDWEGFQEAINNSDIQDKELILRVLSMYSDPEVREREIRNMSQIYTEINKTVFPELRRARFVTDLEYQNWTAEELETLSKSALGLLDEESILRVASNTEDLDRKAALYQYAAEKFDSDRSRFNLAAMALDEQKSAVAEVYLDKVKNADAEVANAKGVAALQRGDLEKAASFFKQSASEQATENLAAIDILNGDYSSAAKALAGKEGVNAALAQILNGDLSAAEKALTGDDAKSDYLRAIIAARRGDKSGVESYLESAGQKCSCLKERAAKDIEFAQFR